MKNLDVWYAHLDIERALQTSDRSSKPKMVKRTEKALAKARTKDSMSPFETDRGGGRRDAHRSRPR